MSMKHTCTQTSHTQKERVVYDLLNRVILNSSFIFIFSQRIHLFETTCSKRARNYSTVAVCVQCALYVLYSIRFFIVDCVYARSYLWTINGYDTNEKYIRITLERIYSCGHVLNK